MRRKGAKIIVQRTHKKCFQMKTAERWAWKSLSDNDCVITHQPNLNALKMNGAKTIEKILIPRLPNKRRSVRLCDVRTSSLLLVDRRE